MVLSDWHREFDQDLKGLDRLTPKLLTTERIHLPTPTDPQKIALACTSRFLVNCWGRGTGKSHVSLRKLHTSALRDPGLYWWVWPTLKSGREFGWEQYVRPYLNSLDLHESTLTVRYPNGSRLQIAGADNSRAQNMRGGALKGAVLDECRNMQRYVWSEVIMSMIARTGGWAWFNSTPRGYDWFHALYQKADTLPGWSRLHFTPYDNPHFPKDEIERMQREMTEREYQQEVMGLFLTDGGLLFRYVTEAATLKESEPRAGRNYLIGADWARSNDYTCFSVFDSASREQVKIDRFTGVDHVIQAERLAALSKRYNRAPVISETNGMGGPLTELVRSKGVNVIPFHTDNPRKKKLVDGLALAFEQRTIKLLNDPIQTEELIAYEIKDRASHLLPTYGAPDGMHDDTCMAAMFAWAGIAGEYRQMSEETRAHMRRVSAF